MPEPPGDYEDFLFDTDNLLAQVKLYRGIAGSAARGNKAVAALLAWVLPDLIELLDEVKVVACSQRGRQATCPPDAPPALFFRTDFLADLERLLGQVEGALTSRH